MNNNYDEINQKNVDIIKSTDDEFLTNKAINELFLNNEGIIRSLINKYSYFIKDDTDIINEAYFVIWECAKRYDSKKNIKFATYFYNSFYKTILNTINSESTISPYIRKKIKLIDDFCALYSLENNISPSVDEIAKELNTTKGKIEEYLRYKEIELERNSIGSIEAYEESSIESILIKELENNKFKEAFNRLTEKEKDILERKYGLNGKKSEDFSSIAKLYHQSGENIRLIHNKAIKKLKVQLGGLKYEKWYWNFKWSYI